MAKYVSIDEAVALTGVSEFQVRGWVRQVKLYGSKKERKQLQKKDGEYQISLKLVDQLAAKTTPSFQPPAPPPPPVQTAYTPPTPPPAAGSHPHTDKLVAILERQMEEKDKQISSLHLKLDGFLERIRELNVIVHDLQKKIQQLTASTGDLHRGSSLQERAHGTQSTASSQERELLSLPQRTFQDWLAAFARGERD